MHSILVIGARTLVVCILVGVILSLEYSMHNITLIKYFAPMHTNMYAMYSS
jgi:hypothetical protein